MTKVIPPQGDLFRLDSPLLGDIQGERTVAEFPFFALTKRAQMEPMTFESETASIEINPSKTGVATIYDKEILLYIASIMVARLEAGETIDRTLSFTANDLFRMTGTNPSARSYSSLKASLARLQGTQIITNIETGGEGSDSAFSWLLKADIKYTKLPSGERRVRHVEVMLCDWLHRAILTDRRIAAYHDDFFKLGPIERRLYELAKFNCVDGAQFEIDAVELAGRVGCSLGATLAGELPAHAARGRARPFDPGVPAVAGRPQGAGTEWRPAPGHDHRDDHARRVAAVHRTARTGGV